MKFDYDKIHNKEWNYMLSLQENEREEYRKKINTISVVWIVFLFFMIGMELVFYVLKANILQWIVWVIITVIVILFMLSFHYRSLVVNNVSKELKNENM